MNTAAKTRQTIGQVQLDEPGLYTIEVRAESINEQSQAGLSISAISLMRE